MVFATCDLTTVIGYLACAQSAFPVIEGGLIAIFLTAFTGFNGFGVRNSLTPAFFITAIAAGFFYIMGLCPDYYAYALLVCFGVAAWLQNNQNAT